MASLGRYPTDPSLVAACRRGDRDAWETLVDRYARLVYSIPRRYGLGDADAEDVMQNVFAIALQRLDQLQDESRLSAWLITTAHRESWRHGRRKPLDIDLQERDIRADSPPEFLTERWETQALVRLALERLGDPCKTLLEALFLRPAGRSYDEIAETLGMKVGSIGPTRARCFRKLEAILREMGVGEVSEPRP